MGKDLLGYKGVKRVLLYVTIITLVQSVTILYQAKWLAEVISALFAREPLQEQFGTTALFLLAFMIRHLANLIMTKLSYQFAEMTGTTIRKQLLDKLFQLGPRYARTEGTGNLVTLALEGVTYFRTYLELIIPRMVGASIIPIIVLAYIFLQDMTAGLILAVTMPILIVFMILIGLAARKQMDQQWKSYRILSNHFVDSLRGLETLKFLGLSRSHQSTIEGVSHAYRSATMRTLRVAFLSSFALDFFAMLSVAMVAVSLGLRLINGEMTLVTGLTILILAPEYFLPVRLVGSDYHATLNGKEAGAAMQSIIDHPVEDASMQGIRPEELNWTQDSSLVLHEIMVKHDQEEKSSLSQASVAIKGLNKIGIVGESGAGKSTFIDVLGGFLRPTSGRIELNGYTVQSLSGEAWQQQTTYIPQSPYLYSASLLENIRFYTPEASTQDVIEVIKAVGLDELVASLPNGYDELIGNGGRTLSGGQEQRVALARALLSKRSIILLDEPTAHLDIETEYELKQTMLPLFDNKLVILATHRLHWMADMDWIIVIDQGQIAETGTHKELVAKRGIYYNMMMSQMEGLQ
ncbi:thiol reductant ABC exporter subunit CydD [Paenibacillus albiflavus]|uniref:Thiol reductant ABC exporter subunit CydD n=1 Tax=Paenibacillus albiflavus TaxID=2545760 RepID=A0A4R4EFC0_9BACL|nr:thiol reductant ABC exporter subunit CydD [Paenibacillus albiflavus]TCZ78754.1 thiol reductant ABC exporter subunit CydD [Paenibacillus albiflavus]